MILSGFQYFQHDPQQRSPPIDKCALSIAQQQQDVLCTPKKTDSCENPDYQKSI